MSGVGNLLNVKVIHSTTLNRVEVLDGLIVNREGVMYAVSLGSDGDPSGDGKGCASNRSSQGKIDL